MYRSSRYFTDSVFRYLCRPLVACFVLPSLPAPKANVASVNTFEGCLDVCDISKPHWMILENVPSIEREEEEQRPVHVSVTSYAAV